MELSIEQKNIVEQIVNQFKKVLTLDKFRSKINSFVDSEYKQGLEKAELEFDMNFVPNRQQTSILQNYVNENIENVSDDVSKQLRGELQRGILNNENLDQLKRRVKNVFKDPKFTNRMKTVLRTEQLRANQLGKYEGALQSGLNMKKYLSVIMDNRTSPICRAEHAKYGTEKQAIPLEDEFVVRVKTGNKTQTVRGQYPVFHPNCRTVALYKVMKE